MARRIPLQEAARLLGLNERTVRRRLRAGTLDGVKDDASGRWLVTMPDDTDIGPDTPDADLRQRVAVLEVQLEATRRELATSTTTLTIERRRYDDQRDTFEKCCGYCRRPNVAAAGPGAGIGVETISS